MKLQDICALPDRQIILHPFFNIGGEYGIIKWILPIFFIIALIYLSITTVRHYQLWKFGNKAPVNKPVHGKFKAFLSNFILQKKYFKEPLTGISQTLVVYGFIGLFLLWTMQFVDVYFIRYFTGHTFLFGYFYILWLFFGDLFRLAIFSGLIAFAVRRYIIKPSSLINERRDFIFIAVLALLVISNLITDSLRIAINGLPEYEAWSFIAFVFAKIYYLIPLPGLEIFYQISWWIFIITAFSMIALLASGKFSHYLFSAFSISRAGNRDYVPEDKYILNINSASGVTSKFSITNLQQNDLLGSEACIRCGKCQEHCPANLTGKTLSPQKITISTFNALHDRFKVSLLKNFDKGTDKSLIPDYINPSDIWACTGCAACEEICPVQVGQLQKIYDLRCNEVLLNEAPFTIDQSNSRIENSHNIYGIELEEKGSWLKEEFNLRTLAENPAVDYLLFLGCQGAYDDRIKEVVRALVKTITSTGLAVGYLGNEEYCCGDHSLRAGNIDLFIKLAKHNIETFAKYNVKKIITICPHGFNVMRKEYLTIKNNLSLFPDYSYEVISHVTLLNDLIISGKIKWLGGPFNQVVAYHDPCFLGRYNNIYDEPRQLLHSVPGFYITEIAQNREKSLCCGGGSGQIFLDNDRGEPIQNLLAREAHISGARIVITACPSCLSRMEEGVENQNIKNLQIMDIAELVEKYRLKE